MDNPEKSDLDTAANLLRLQANAVKRLRSDFDPKLHEDQFDYGTEVASRIIEAAEWLEAGGIEAEHRRDNDEIIELKKANGVHRRERDEARADADRVRALLRERDAELQDSASKIWQRTQERDEARRNLNHPHRCEPYQRVEKMLTASRAESENRQARINVLTDRNARQARFFEEMCTALGIRTDASWERLVEAVKIAAQAAKVSDQVVERLQLQIVEAKNLSRQPVMKLVNALREKSPRSLRKSLRREGHPVDTKITVPEEPQSEAVAEVISEVLPDGRPRYGYVGTTMHQHDWHEGPEMGLSPCVHWYCRHTGCTQTWITRP